MKSLAVSIFVVTCALSSWSDIGAQPAAQDLAAHCNPATVESRSNLVRVRCTAAVGNGKYYAVPTTNAATAERFVAIALAALINNKRLTIIYKFQDPNGPNFGCLPPNCRPAQTILIEP